MIVGPSASPFAALTASCPPVAPQLAPFDITWVAAAFAIAAFLAWALLRR